MYNEERREPSIYLRGTPLVTGNHSDGVLLRITHCFLSSSQFSIHATIDSLIVIELSFTVKCLSGTMSDALL